MGREARCTAHVGRQKGKGKLLLETTELIFRGPFRVVIPIKDMKQVEADEGELRLRFGRRKARFELGVAASIWAKAIREPRGLLDKLGVKEGHRIALIGVEDAAFRKDLKKRGALLVERVSREIDILFFRLTSAADLKRFESLRPYLKSDGALWVLRPKGPDGVSESATMAAGKTAGLVDVKVVAFSPALTAEKFVIPLTRR